MSPDIPHRTQSRQGAEPSRFRAAEPVCRNCGPDAHLSYESFVPTRFNPGTDRMIPSMVHYLCARCGRRYTQYAPEGWAPPGWQWYD